MSASVSSALIRVEAADARLTASLAQKLRGLFEVEVVAIDQESNDVTLRTHGDPSKAFVSIFDTVEAWLAEARLPATRIHLDGRSYTITAPDHDDRP